MTEYKTYRTEQVRLAAFGMDIESIRAFMWAELEKLTIGVTQNYRSDLYHDALFVSKLDIKDGTTFFFAYGENGTFMEFDAYIYPYREFGTKVTLTSQPVREGSSLMYWTLVIEWQKEDKCD